MDATVNSNDVRMVQLRNQPRRYSFFQALRDIESSAARAPRLGHAHSPAQEAVRVGQTPSLEFAPTAIEGARQTVDGRIKIDQRSFGMLGPSGVLPLHLTEVVRNRALHAGDPSLHAFIDLFHHRMSLLFYRAWSSSQPAVQRDRPWQDRYAVFVAALSGLAFKSSRDRDNWSDESKRFFVGRLAPLRRNAEGLSAIIARMLSCQVAIHPFQLCRLKLQDSERTQIARRSNCLGSTAVLGGSVADRQSLFEVRLGPLSFEQFSELLPGNQSRSTIEDVIRNYAGPGLDARVRLVLAAAAVPRVPLGKTAVLGRSVWLTSKTPQADADECCTQMTARGTIASGCDSSTSQD